MFEDSTFESQGRIHTRSSNWMLATLLFNGTILLTFILMPLIYPSTLPNQWRINPITTPAPQQSAPQQTTHASSQATSAPRLIEMPLINTPTMIHIGRAATDAPPSTTNDNPIGDPIGTGKGSIPGGDPFSHTANSTVHVTKPTGTLTISKGVAEGMIVQRIVPVYPAIARAVRLEGTVVLQATISKTGTIENLRILSGPQILQQAAINAVQQWRYRPYLLNGDPVEVETTINVNFTLGR